MKKLFLLFAALSAAFQLNAYFDWDSFKTADFTIFYQHAYKSRALRMLSDLEYYKHIPEDIVGNKIGNVPITLEDWGQYDNGLTDPVFYKINVINYESEDADWLALVSIHEYTHMIHLTETGGIPSAFVCLFGNAFSAQITAPDFTMEAIAVYNESKLSKYMGRLSDGGFDRYMMMKGSENSLPKLLDAVYTPFGMPGGDAVYIYGSEFINYLSQKYGQDTLKKLYASYSSSVLSWLSPVFPWAGIDRTFTEIYGHSTEELWNGWLKSVSETSKAYTQDGKRLTFHGWQSSWPCFYKGKVYYVKSVGYKTGAFMEYYTNDIIEYDPKTAQSRSVVSTTSQFMAPPQFFGGRIYYSVAEIKFGYANESNLNGGIYSVVYEKDLATGAEHELFSDAVRGFCVEDDGGILYSVDNAYSIGSRLMRYDPQSGDKKPVFETPYLIFNLACGGGITAVEAKAEGNNSSIYILDMKEKKFIPVSDTPYYEMQPEIYGGKIFYQANYGKKYLSYCYDVKENKYYSVVSNGYSSTPAYDAGNGNIYFAGLNTDGYDIYSEKADFKQIKLPQEVNDYILPPLLDSSKIAHGSYLDNIAAAFPRVRVPLFYLDSYNNPCAGLEVMGEDVMGDLSYDAAAVYDFGLQRTNWSLKTLSLLFSPAEFVINAASTNNGEFAPLLAVPFYKSMRPGLSLIYGELEYDLYDISAKQGTHARVIPTLGAGFTWPLTLFSLSAGKILEPGDRASGASGIMLNAAFTQYCGEMRFNVNSSYVYDHDFEGNILQKIRGYANALSGNSGTTVIIDVTRPLIKVRNGLWNPFNIYVEDICGGLFTDSQLSGGKTQLSYGAEISAETKFLFALSGPVILRFSYNKEDEFKTTLTFGNINLPF